MTAAARWPHCLDLIKRPGCCTAVHVQSCGLLPLMNCHAQAAAEAAAKRFAQVPEAKPAPARQRSAAGRPKQPFFDLAGSDDDEQPGITDQQPASRQQSGQMSGESEPEEGGCDLDRIAESFQMVKIVEPPAEPRPAKQPRLALKQESTPTQPATSSHQQQPARSAAVPEVKPQQGATARPTAAALPAHRQQVRFDTPVDQAHRSKQAAAALARLASSQPAHSSSGTTQAAHSSAGAAQPARTEPMQGRAAITAPPMPGKTSPGTSRPSLALPPWPSAKPPAAELGQQQGLKRPAPSQTGRAGSALQQQAQDRKLPAAAQGRRLPAATPRSAKHRCVDLTADSDDETEDEDAQQPTQLYPVPGSAAAEAGWTCSTCTLLNASKEGKCDMCNAARPLVLQPANDGRH